MILWFLLSDLWMDLMEDCLNDLGKWPQPATDREKRWQQWKSGSYSTQEISKPPKAPCMQLYDSANVYASWVAECSGESLKIVAWEKKRSES